VYRVSSNGQISEFPVTFSCASDEQAIEVARHDCDKQRRDLARRTVHDQSAAPGIEAGPILIDRPPGALSDWTETAPMRRSGQGAT